MHELPIEVDTTFLDKHGLALTLAVVFALVIAYLFRLLVKSHKERVTELLGQLAKADRDRESAEKMRMGERETHSIAIARWDVERAEHDLEISRVREMCEQRMREAADRHARDLHELRKEFQAREDEARKENAEAAERMEEAHTKAMDKVTAVLQKFYDRFVGPRSRTRDRG
jgi:hypothetical protein